MLIKGETAVYAPRVFAYIATSEGTAEYMDVSEDIKQCTVNRILDGASSGTLKLINTGGKYLGKFKPMDRIIIEATRDGSTRQKLLTGYITSCDFYKLYNGDMSISFSDTIYRLQRLLWDPNLIASQQLMNNVQYQYSKNDGGLALIAKNILTQVAGMDTSMIHIQQSIPQSVFDWAYEMYKKQLGDLEAAEQMATALYSLYVDCTGSAKGQVSGLEYGNGGLAIPIYYQNDDQWKDNQWGTAAGDTIEDCGCCQTCMAMYLTYRLGYKVTPADVVKVANEKYPGMLLANGTSWSFPSAICGYYKVDKPSRVGLDSDTIVKYLLNGQAVLLSITGGFFSNNGHFILLRGASSADMIYVNDPAGYHWSDEFLNSKGRTEDRMRDPKTAYFTRSEVFSNAKAAWVFPKKSS